MKRILVTGGAGYIETHARKAHAAADFSPICFDNLSRCHAHSVKWEPLVQGDLRDPQAVDQAIAEIWPAAVMHFAAPAPLRIRY